MSQSTLIAAGALLPVSKSLHFSTKAKSSSSHRSRMLSTAAIQPPVQNAETAVERNQLTTQPDISTPLRHLTRGNQVFAGFILHQHRKRVNVPCTAHFPCRLSRFCQRSIGTAPSAPSDTYTLSSVKPFGVDPVFNVRSSMYQPDAARRPWQYYDASEMSASGIPYAFYHRPAFGFDDGFPIVFPVCLSCAILHVWSFFRPIASMC
jgi:hypothetical protein